MVNCKFCGNIIKRRPNEHPGRYSERKFCNHKCEGKSQRKEFPTQNALSARARVVALKNCCELCGGNHLLAVHHKDQNRYNDDPKNLVTLCANCHSKLHYDERGSPRPPGLPCLICGGEHYGVGLCTKHYQRLKANGSPLIKYNKISKLYEIELEVKK